NLQMAEASGDEDFAMDDAMGQNTTTEEGPISSLESGYLVNKFDRPLPVKEDLVVFVDGGRTKIGYVSKVGFKDDRQAALSDCRAGTYFNVDDIPSLKPSQVAGCEAITIERCFSVGETVMAFKNKHEGTKQACNRCHSMTMIGQIIAVRTTADVLVLPEKSTILKDVPIENNYKMLEMMNYNSSHNYVLYKDWIGDITEMDNEVVCLYYKQRVRILETSKQESYFRRKGDHRRSNKSYIPGETVYVELHHLVGNKHAKWEGGEAPSGLKRKANKSYYSGAQKMRLVVEKVEPVSVGVKWIQSPSSMVMPETPIMKEDMENMILIDVSANPRVSSADRMVFTLKDEVRKMTKKEHSQWITDEYKGWFVNPKRMPKSKAEGESSQLNPVMEEEEEMKSTKDEDEEEMEVDEQATGDNADDEDEEEKPAPTRSSNRLKRGRKQGVRGREIREPRKKRGAPSAVAPAAQPEKKKKDGNWVKGVFIGEILLSRTICDVEWMDGTISKDVHGASLVPIDPDLDQQDHLPGNIVTKKHEDLSVVPDEVFGIILRVNPDERVATVRWFKLLDARRVDGGAEQMEDEEVTLFDIMMHPWYRRQFPGYLGVGMSKADKMAHPDLRQTCLKILTNLQNGKQLVEYMDKSTEELWPMEIMALPLHEHEEASEVDFNLADETTDGWQAMDESVASSTAATAGTAASTAVSVAGGAGSSNGGTIDEPANTPSTSRASTRTTRSSAKKKKKNEEEEIEELVPKSLPMFEKGTLTMLDGEVIVSHKYLNETINPIRPWMKAVMREHAHLKEHLPKEIHLWAWEKRLDLLTLVIFGPSGTPFELTPFHFDIHIPDNFPAAPPKVHYYAWSQEQLNPNLYQVGKVCVSLLGTWDGAGAEKWTPTSNLLQVFISIQGLILNAEPYFNEAGYEERKNVPEHEANSKRYNETATINSLEYMWRIYDRPPEHIKSVVRQGVDSRIAEFKKRVLSWADGKKQPEFPVHSSKGFKLALKTSMNKVVSILNQHQNSA
ncbi:hypothetical protein PRIPAC_94865, partial [Pristionchus pacificus]